MLEEGGVVSGHKKHRSHREHKTHHTKPGRHERKRERGDTGEGEEGSVETSVKRTLKERHVKSRTFLWIILMNVCLLCD